MPWTDRMMAIGARLVPEGVRRSSWLRPRYPLVGIELREDAVVAARLAHRSGKYRLVGYGKRSLPDGAFSASLMEPGVGDAAALSRGIADVLKMAGAEGTGRVSVAVPDTAIRVFLADLSELPPSRAQADEMIRFRIRKSVPFRPEDSRLSWDVVSRTDDGRVMVLVAVAPEQAVRPIESLFRKMGIRCGLVDLATFDVFNALRLEGALDGAAGGADVALLNATQAYFSVLILRGGELIFYRSKNYHQQGGFQGEESLRVVGRELRSTLGYYEEHLQGRGIERMYVRVAGIEPEGLLEAVRGAGVTSACPAAFEKTVPELKHVPADIAVELLPAIGLALRRHA